MILYKATFQRGADLQERFVRTHRYGLQAARAEARLVRPRGYELVMIASQGKI